MKYLKSIIGLLIITLFFGCEMPLHEEPKSSSGVTKATTKIKTGSDGLTVEQRNISNRLKVDNEIGAIKHLYIISAMSGQTIIYSTVDGKVTSGGKRLTPKTLDTSSITPRIKIGDDFYRTGEVIQDDGTYGDSMNYLYWWDVKGIYHQHYVTGGQIVHIASEALPVSDITINLSK